MNSMLSRTIWKRLRQARVIPTVVIDDVNNAIPLVHLLHEVGISSIEITLRSDCAIDAIRLTCRKYPEILVGAGTVLTSEQVRQVKDAGAAFAVAPGLNPMVVEEALRVDLLFAPGVCTPSEIEQALGYGYKVLKFFPSEPLGGIKYLKCMAAPYLHTDIGFIPFGGIGAHNFIDYLKQDYIIAVGGSWLAPQNLITQRDWHEIRRLCTEARSRLSVLEQDFHQELQNSSMERVLT